MKLVQLGQSDLHVTPICLGTMTFGEQVSEADSHAILSRSLERGVNFLDTAEMYSVPARAETFNLTEKIVGNWLEKTPGARDKMVIATKAAGPFRGMPWIRDASPDLTGAQLIAACEDSLKRLKTDVIDLYQLHWPTRNVPVFGGMYFDPTKDIPNLTNIHGQLEALQTLVKAGKVRAIGLSNETPYGLHEFIRLAEQYDLPRVATVQNPYCLINRTVENGLDESMHRLGVSLLAYSPLGFGLLSGKYDAAGLNGPDAAEGRMSKFESMRKQRWGRADSLKAAVRYNALAREYGLTPTQMALAFCYTKWQVTSTIIGVTTLAQLDEDIDAWGTTLPPELLQKIDAVRWEIRDPAV